ncbi:MAG: choice-of-anchor D domain-containing protein [Myxococcales bacterium]|nr:choice-of-anchor D domain-containing protein [Myxococcales bacterium]
MNRFTLALGVALTFLAGCNDDNDLGRVEGVLDVPDFIDFGDVQIGVTAKKVVTLKNSGRGSVVITGFKGGADISGSAYQYILPQDRVTVSAGTSEEVQVAFQPFQASETQYVVQVNIELADGTSITLELRGRGVDSGLEITPNPLDFGSVLVGTSRTLELTLTNRLSDAVVLRSTDHRNGKPEAQSSSGNGTFDIDVAVDANGSLMAGALLAPGASITVPVTYRPDPSDLAPQDRARWTLSNCDYPLCEVQVDLRGRGTTAALECAPAGLVFGPVPPNQTQTLTVTCTNVATDDIEVLSWSLEPGTASEFLVPGGSRGQTLAPGGTLDIDIDFTPTQTTWDTAAMPTGELAVASRHIQGGPLDPVLVTLTGRAGGPAIQVTPSALHFGDIGVGTSHSKLLLVENRGLEDLVVSMVDNDVAGTGAFSTDATAFTLAPGSSTVVTAAFSPVTTGQVSSQIRFFSNDALNPQIDVAVDGGGLALPPCAYRITPTQLLFGAVPFTQTVTQGVRIENTGNDACLINDLDIIPTTFGSTTAYTLVNGTQTGVTLASGAYLDVPIQYRPVAAGGDRAHLGFYISDPNNSNPTVLLYGVGEPLVQVECPPPITTQAGVPVSLSAIGTALGANITGYAWAITNAPIGGIGTPNQWLPAPPNAPTETFLPYIVGVYDIGQSGDWSYIVMEYVRGPNLSMLLKASAPPARRDIVRYMAQVADAMDYAHGQGVVHRDLKPANLLVSLEGQVKVTDFGIAHILQDRDEKTAFAAAGMQVGTVNYMAPEQVTGGRIGPPTDIYLLGTTVFFCLSRNYPYGGHLPLLAKVQEDAAPLRSLLPDVSPELDLAVNRALARQPEARHASMGAFAAALRATPEFRGA